MEVHGITDEFLADKPLFADVVEDFMAFIGDADLVIHNAPFDVGFINHELAKLPDQGAAVEDRRRIIDTLSLAKQKHPGQRNNLDALCKRYAVDNSQRELHGALLDAEILADVYLLMTGGQVSLNISDNGNSESGEVTSATGIRRLAKDRPALRVIRADDQELESHRQKLASIQSASGSCVWHDQEH
jgi:DNA polymerase-3 subunit epsilon